MPQPQLRDTIHVAGLRQLKKVAIGWWTEFGQKFNSLREHALGNARFIRIDQRGEAAFRPSQQTITLSRCRLWSKDFNYSGIAADGELAPLIQAHQLMSDEFKRP
jgi:hypothetical protein